MSHKLDLLLDQLPDRVGLSDKKLKVIHDQECVRDMALLEAWLQQNMGHYDVVFGERAVDTILRILNDRVTAVPAVAIWPAGATAPTPAEGTQYEVAIVSAPNRLYCMQLLRQEVGALAIVQVRDAINALPTPIVLRHFDEGQTVQTTVPLRVGFASQWRSPRDLMEDYVRSLDLNQVGIQVTEIEYGQRRILQNFILRAPTYE